MKVYEEIVFMQGSEAEEPLAILDEQGRDAAIEYLAQWDQGEGEVNKGPLCGTRDTVYTAPDGYRLTYSLSLGYIGLERELEVE